MVNTVKYLINNTNHNDLCKHDQILCYIVLILYLVNSVITKVLYFIMIVLLLIFNSNKECECSFDCTVSCTQ